MRKALIVGIDYYETIGSLFGCVNDALTVKNMLARHANGDINFATPNILTATDADSAVTTRALKQAVKDLFADDSDIAIFYFAGHGYAEDTGGFLCTSECQSGDDGLALSDVMTFANMSDAKNKVIVLDSCYSGAAGSRSTQRAVSEIAEGVTVLTASTAKQYADEGNGSGLFTGLLVNALNGAAANLLGDVTPGSVYAHIDQSLGPWEQRPVFKTNVKAFASLREAEPPIPVQALRELTKHFPTPDHSFQLDPAYEPERNSDQLKDPAIPPPDPAKTAVFRTLQNYFAVNLVRPVGVPFMWHAAMQSKTCALTTLGRHYWDLVDRQLI